MVRHIVEQDADAPLMGRFDQTVEVVERTEQWSHVGVVGDVVAKVGHRRRKDRRYPDRIDAQPDQVIEPVDNPWQIAGSIAIAVHERSRINLIDDPALPPGVVFKSVHLSEDFNLPTA